MADNDSGLGGEVKDLVQLLRDYAKQETVGPLRNLGRYLAFGIAGAIMMALAVVFLVLGGVRVLQSELTAFDGNWSFVPDLVGVAALLLIIAVAGMAVAREGKQSDGQAN